MKCRLLIITVLIFLSGACRKDPYHLSIPETSLHISIKRLEVDLFALDPDSIMEKVPVFHDKYGAFFDLFNYQIINIGGTGQVTYPQYLTLFLTDYLNNEVSRKTMELYPDLSWLEEQLSDAFGRYKYYFPEKQIPAVYTFISGFNQSIVIGDSILAIGLDKYLGTDCYYYKRLGLQKYMIKNMFKDKIVTDCISAWCSTEFIYNDSVDNILSNMIYQGKIWYLTKSLLPDQPDYLVTGFSPEELDFCRKNEGRMWEYLVEHKILFMSDRLTIQKFAGNGPFTKDFGTKSPAKASSWIGWRIVENYAARNHSITMKELMNEDDFQKILSLSRYNP